MLLLLSIYCYTPCMYPSHYNFHSFILYNQIHPKSSQTQREKIRLEYIGQAHFICMYLTEPQNFDKLLVFPQEVRGFRTVACFIIRAYNVCMSLEPGNCAKLQVFRENNQIVRIDVLLPL